VASIEGQTIHRVLLVDDDEVVLDMMSESLKSKGFEVVAVGGVGSSEMHFHSEL
jgi:CheY-like chemotaxis protein